MPGIAGILSKNKSNETPHLLNKMLDSMMHETFYSKSIHTDQEHGWYCGSVAIRGSFSDNMPILNKKRNIVLFFSGELFTDTQVLNQHEVNNSNPVNHVIHLYEDQGPDFVKKLNGWFSGIILDHRRNKAILFNDWYAMCRVYYYEDENAFYFASEAKALLKVLPSLRELDINSVSEYLCFNCVLDNRSFFQGINILPGGSIWSSNGKSLKKKSYFDFSQLENKASINTKDFSEQLMFTFKNILPRYLRGDRIAIALTGGLDTRLIMACLPHDVHNVTTYTWGSMYRDSKDVLLARKISQACNLKHHTMHLDTNFLREYPKNAEKTIYITDGQANINMMDELYLSTQVRQIAPIVLQGFYGTQVLKRTGPFMVYRPVISDLINIEFKNNMIETSKKIQPFQKENSLTNFLKRELPWNWAGQTLAKMSQLSFRSPFLDNDFIELAYCAPNQGFDGTEFKITAISKNRRNLLDIQTNRGVAFNSGFFSSSVSQNITRVRKLAEIALSSDVLPHSLHHQIAKLDAQVLSPLHLNRLILGFDSFRHYNFWTRNILAPYIKAILFDSRTLSRPYWNKFVLIKIVNDHIQGRGRYMREISKILKLELIHRTLIGEN